MLGSMVYGWLIHSALASLAILLFGSLGVLIWRQPARRARIIELTLGGCLIAPVLGMIPGYPKLAISSLAARSNDRQGESPASLDDQATKQTVASGREFSENDALSSPGPAFTTVAAPGHKLDIRSLIAVLYIFGVGLGAAWWLTGMGVLARIVRTSQPAPAHCRQLLSQVSGRRGRRVRLLISRQLGQPFAAWLGRPVIILPENLCGNDQAVLWCLAHECAHIERHDFRSWLLANFSRALFFYQPLVWWMRNQLRLCQDIVADMHAARQSPQSEDYAEFLTIRAAAGPLRPAMVGIGMGFHKSELYRRIIMLMQNHLIESRAPRLWTLSTTLTAILLIAAAAALSMSRSAAAEPKQEATVAQDADRNANVQKDAAVGATVAAINASQTDKNDHERLIMMGRVEDFFMHNFRDVTSRKSLEWGEVENHKDGSQSIRYKYLARIWDKETFINNQVFTFDKQGKFVSVKNVKGFPEKKEQKKVDVTTKKGVIDLVEDFFHNNFRDVKSRKTIEWGDLEKQSNGNVSIRYQYSCKIWDKDAKIMNQIFTFDSKGEYVSVKNVAGFPQDLK
jgi:beta-lactamase regulating signal transducer with metallopeptidase domain